MDKTEERQVLLDRVFKSRTTELLPAEAWKQDWWNLLSAKLLIGLFLPFFSDEAYYWVWSHNLKLSYFDHPPMTAWIFWIGHLFESYQFAARIPFVILSHLTLWIWCDLLANQLNEKEKRTLLWLLVLHPLVGLGGLVANPDIPFLFFWSLSLALYLACLRNPDSWKLPFAFGASLGLGFDSKYLMGLITPVIILHLIVSGEWRKLRAHHIILPVFIGFIASLPVWIWNFQNDWSSFKFQLHHGLGQDTWKPKWTLEFLLGTCVLLFPPFVLIFFKHLKSSIKNLHLLLFLGLLLFFTYTTFKGDTELNWPLAMYPSFLLLLAPIVSGTKWSKFYFVFFGGLAAVLLSFPFISAVKPMHPRLHEGYLYKSLFEETQEFRPLYLHTYQAASYFYFLSKTPFYKLRGASRVDEYDSMPQSQPSEDTFYYFKEPYQDIPAAQLEIFDFQKVQDLKFGFELFRVERKK